MNENTHNGQSTTAVFVTAEQKAAGLDPAAVAAAAASANKSTAVSQPGQRGITVQHIAGPQVQQGVPRGVTQPAQVFAAAPQLLAGEQAPAIVAGPNAPVPEGALVLAGVAAIEAAKRLGRGVNTPVGQLPPDGARIFLSGASQSVTLAVSSADAALLAQPVAADPPIVAQLGAPPAPELAQTPLPPAGGTGGGSTDSTGDGHHDFAAQRAYARAPGAQLVVEFRGPVRLVTTGRVHVTHETDTESGLDVVELTPHGDSTELDADEPTVVDEVPSEATPA